MPQPKSIQINIPEPCSQNWGDMTPSGQGRFCDSCQKTVIDFSTWSDAALYEFFSKQKDSLCGRFRTSQVGRHIYIPPQPHSQLYKMVVALGLTLIFTQGSAVYAQSKAPLVQTASPENVKDGKPDSTFQPTVVGDSITATVLIGPSRGPEIYTMGVLPPTIFDKKIIVPSIFSYSVCTVNNKVPLPKRIKEIRIPKKPRK